MRTISARFEQIRLYAAVAEFGSFTRAAERLGCSKAHVSATVSALEAGLGVQLLHRTTRRLNLTDAGRTYLDYCRQIGELLQQAEHAVSAVTTDISGRLRFTAPSSFGEVFLAEIADIFRRTYPQVDLDVDLSVAQRDLIADGYDCAIRSARTIDDSLVARPVGVIREIVVASPSLLRRYGPIVAPEDLVRLPCVVNSNFRDDPYWVFQRSGRAITISVGGGLGVNAYGTIKRAVLADLGAARLPRYLVREELATGSLVQLLADFELGATPLWLVYPQSRHRPLRTRVFIDFLLRWFEDPPQRALFT